MTQREIQSDPNIPDPNSPAAGQASSPPIGKKGHFPPRVMFTPQVDLFHIEHTNRDSIVSPGPDHIRGTADDIVLPSRFNVDPAFIPPGKNLPPPESYGFLSGLLPSAQSRGIGTLPGGIPLYQERKQLVGGIGVFFPGTTGFATEENSDLNDAGFYDPTSPTCRSRPSTSPSSPPAAARWRAPRSTRREERAARAAVVPRGRQVRPPVRPDRPGRHHARHLRRRRPARAAGTSSTTAGRSAWATPTAA